MEMAQVSQLGGPSGRRWATVVQELVELLGYDQVDIQATSNITAEA